MVPLLLLMMQSLMVVVLLLLLLMMLAPHLPLLLPLTQPLQWQQRVLPLRQRGRCHQSLLQLVGTSSVGMCHLTPPLQHLRSLLLVKGRQWRGAQALPLVQTADMLQTPGQKACATSCVRTNHMCFAKWDTS